MQFVTVIWDALENVNLALRGVGAAIVGGFDKFNDTLRATLKV